MEIYITIIGTLTAVITVTLTNYFAKKNQLKFEQRKLKEAYYTAFIQAVSESVVSNHSEKSRDKLADCQNKLLLVGSASVIKNLMVFHDYIKPPCDNFSTDKHDLLLTELMKSMREDLFSSSKVNIGYPIIHLTGKSSSRTTGGKSNGQS